MPGLVGDTRVVVAQYRRANQSGVVHSAFSHAPPVVSTDAVDQAEVLRYRE